MFVRHQTLRRSSLLMQMDILRKIKLSEPEEKDEIEPEDFPAIKPTETITITVGDTIFKTYACSLLTFPCSLLTMKYLEFCIIAGKTSGCKLSFQRDPKMFSYILDAYERKHVHVPREVCINLFKREMEFWNIKHSLVAPCCHDCYMEAFEDIYQDDVMQQNVSTMSFNYNLSKTYYHSCKEILWEFLEDPEFSRKAKWWSWVYKFMIVLSISLLFFSTNARFRYPVQSNSTSLKKYETLTDMLVSTNPHPALNALEMFCTVFFTVVLVTRTVCAPGLLDFCRSFEFVVEMVYLLSNWTLLLIFYADPTYWTVPGRVPAYQFLQLLSLTRFSRLRLMENSYEIFKLLRISVRTSRNEIRMLVTFVAIATIFYGGMFYCTEMMAETTLGTTYSGMWMALITMSTVGYGDFIPSTTLGRIIASLCALSGIVIIGMPLPLITSSFYEYYEYVYCSCHGNKISSYSSCINTKLKDSKKKKRENK